MILGVFLYKSSDDTSPRENPLGNIETAHLLHTFFCLPLKIVLYVQKLKYDSIFDQLSIYFEYLPEEDYP